MDILSADNAQNLENSINAYYGCQNVYILGEEIDERTFHIINTNSMKHEGKAVYKRRKWYYVV